MKKFLIIVTMFLIFLFIYFLQSNFFDWFNLAGIKPNLFIIFILLIGLFVGRTIGVSLGIFFGLSLDIFLGKKLGVSAAMLGTIGFLGGYLDKNFSKDSRITIMLMSVGATIVYELGIYIFNNIAVIHSLTNILSFFKILLIEVLFNVILVIILYPILLKGGYYIENNIKKQKILTRYF